MRQTNNGQSPCLIVESSSWASVRTERGIAETKNLAVCLVQALDHHDPPCSPWSLHSWSLSSSPENGSWWRETPGFGDRGKHLRTVMGKVSFISFWGPPRDCSLKLPDERGHGESQVLSKHTKNRLWSGHRVPLRSNRSRRRDFLHFDWNMLKRSRNTLSAVEKITSGLGLVWDLLYLRKDFRISWVVKLCSRSNTLQITMSCRHSSPRRPRINETKYVRPALPKTRKFLFCI